MYGGEGLFGQAVGARKKILVTMARSHDLVSANNPLTGIALGRPRHHAKTPKFTHGSGQWGQRQIKPAASKKGREHAQKTDSRGVQPFDGRRPVLARAVEFHFGAHFLARTALQLFLALKEATDLRLSAGKAGTIDGPRSSV